MIKKYKVSLFIFGAFILLSLFTLLTTKSMTLEKKIELTDYITLIALAITFVAGAFAIYFKSQQAKELNAQREKDRVAIAQSNEKSELARKESENAKKDAANSNEKAANAELRSKELEIELLKLRLAVSPRFLPDFVKKELATALSKYPARKAEIMCAVSNDAEPMEFSNILAGFLKSVGWQVDIHNEGNTMLPAPTGIKIYAGGKINLEIAQLMETEFKKINYQCDVIKRQGETEAILFEVNAKK